MELTGTIIIISMGMIAIAGGLGGGALFCPLIMIFFMMDAHEAIPLSNALTFFNSVVKYAMSLNEKHPKIPHKPLIDFNVAIIFNPMIMLGSFIGVIVAILLPGIVCMLILTVTLVIAIYDSAKSTLRIYRKENAEIEMKEKEKENQLTKELLPISKDSGVIPISKESEELISPHT